MGKRIFFFVILASCSILSAQDDSCACCSDNHKAFDFWVGTWNVTNPDGSLAGTNTIEKIENGCVIRENWVGANGEFSGTSINYFNLKTNQWEQLWVDNSGTHLKLKGNRTGNQMVLSSDESTNADGKDYINRITWTLHDDGSVRQLWEVLQEGQVTNIAFDGLYRKFE
ncbi:MAG: hypothetical protein HKN31_08155 [Pricia sp.]|nr:hypothetical protein [Pricia sp.]